VEESVSENSDWLGYWRGDGGLGVSVGFDSRLRVGVTVGVRVLLVAGVMLREGKLALLFASCLVSKGVGVDGVRDSLTVTVSRSNVDVKKKVKGLCVTRPH
jgi:hypothetical protein